MSAFITRFAPSPTGRLHLGHAYSALRAYDAARTASGRFLLRIEDIDSTRSRPAFESSIMEDLAWLGVRWEDPVRRQSEHTGEYAAAIDRLRGRGLLYRCFRTRRNVLDEIARAPHGPADDPLAFTGAPLPPEEEAALLAAGRSYAWRLSLARAEATLGGFQGLGFVEASGRHGAPGSRRPVDLGRQGDVVLSRKDIGIAYHLAVVVDDASQGVTQVVRGADLYAAASVQVLLQALLGLPTPSYRHHRLLLGADGKRLAKRNGAIAIAALRDSGVTPEQIRIQIGLNAPALS